PPSESSTLSLHDALPILSQRGDAAIVHVRSGLRDVAQSRHAPFTEVAVLRLDVPGADRVRAGLVVVEAPEQGVWALLELADTQRSEEHTSELQSLRHLVC